MRDPGSAITRLVLVMLGVTAASCSSDGGGGGASEAGAGGSGGSSGAGGSSIGATGGTATGGAGVGGASTGGSGATSTGGAATGGAGTGGTTSGTGGAATGGTTSGGSGGTTSDSGNGGAVSGGSGGTTRDGGSPDSGVSGSGGNGTDSGPSCAADRCGGVTTSAGIIDCGGCPSGTTCGGGPDPGACGCTPLTCARLGMNCGTVDDGCGHVLTCGTGTCSGGLVCGANGIPNVCGAADCMNGWCTVHGEVIPQLYGVWLTSATDGWAVGPNGTVERFNGTTWAPATSGTTTTLNDVWASSTSDAYAVGYGGTILHFNGTAWSPSTSNSTADLFGIFGTGPNDIWAVGPTTILHYDGSWTEKQTDPQVSRVWAFDANNAYAVGDAGIIKWNGASWSLDNATPMLAVWGTSASDVWAVGATGVMHRTAGSGWQSIPSGPPTSGSAIFARSATDVWVTSNGPEPTQAPLTDCACGGRLFHWNGTTWGQLPTLNVSGYADMHGLPSGSIWIAGSGLSHFENQRFTGPGGDIAFPGDGGFSLWASGKNDVWTLGGAQSLIHFDGARWTTDYVGDVVPGVQLGAVSGFSPNDVWATGIATTANDATVVLRYDGDHWSQMSTPNFDSIPGAIWGTSPNDVWIGAGHHWDGATWTTLPGTPTDEQIDSLWGSAANDVWATNGSLLHFDGTAWQDKTSALLDSNATQNHGVSGSGANDVWVAGAKMHHFASGSWSTTPIPGDSAAAVFGDSPTSATAIIAGGPVARWNGTDWRGLVSPFDTADSNLYALWSDHKGTILASGGPGVYRVDDKSYTSAINRAWSTNLGQGWASSATDIWIAGSTGVAHSNGTSWDLIGTGSQGLVAVWGSASNDVWLVGSSVLHWQGSSFQPADPPVQGLATSVSGTATNDVWIVTKQGNIAHYNGLAWSDVTPTFVGETPVLMGVWAHTASDAWACGYGSTSGNGVVLHYDGAHWTPKASSVGYCNAVWGTATDVYFAGGGAFDYVVASDKFSAITPSSHVSTPFTSVGGDDTRVFFVGGFSIMSSTGAVTTLPFGNLNGVFGFGNTVWAASSGGLVLRNGG